MKKIKTVIIGMGRMGKTRYSAMTRHGGYEITAVCDTQIRQLSQYQMKTYTDWKKCIGEQKPDAVIICTVNAVIPEIVCFALENGCHVFAEKPPGTCLSDALYMQKCSSLHPDCILKFGFNHRYHNSIIEAKSLVESGLLGTVVSARGVYGKAGNLKTDEWRNDPSLSGGGILLDQGIHLLDLLRYFVGDFSYVKGFIDNLVWKGCPGEDTAFITLKTPDNRIATLHSSAIQWKHKFDLDLICTNGYIALNGLLTSTKSYGEERITYYKKDLDNKNGRPGNPKEYTLCFDTDESWDYEMEEFYEGIVIKTPVINGTVHDAVQVMKLIDCVYQKRKVDSGIV